MPLLAEISKEMPLSRFWSCLFSFSIFAPLWTGKMHKTRRWIPLFVLFIAVWFVLDPILNPIPEDFNIMTDEWFGPVESIMTDTIKNYIPGDDFDGIASSLSFSLSTLFFLVAYVGSLFILIYLMFKWTTAYNMDKFGYESKKEWKKANFPRQNIRQIMSNTMSGAKDKIPYEKIHDVSAKAGKGMSDARRGVTNATKNLRHESKMSEEDKRKQIKEWHNMMTMGFIEKSEFEKKKADLLKSD